MKINNKYSGFSLIEMSIVLLIVALIVGSGLVVFNQYSAQSKHSQTEDKIRYILAATKKYVKFYGRLPCPADAQLPMNNADFGEEQRSDDTECALVETDGSYRGMVPVMALGLYPTMALDGWDRRFYYIVEKDDIAKDSMKASSTDTGSHIDVRNFNGNLTSHNVVVLVLSAGENGYGAVSGRGGSPFLPVDSHSMHPHEDSNYETGTFFTHPPIDGYDDIVDFMTYEQLRTTQIDDE